MKAHPDPHGGAVEPQVAGQVPLSGDRGPHCPNRAAEHHEEGIPLGADLDPAVRAGGTAYDHGVFVPDRPISITELLEQLGGALDIGEQEGDRPGRKLCHVRQECSASGDGSELIAGQGHAHEPAD